MVQLGDLDVSDSHPLVSELSSLRSAVARFQDEAHSSSVKLQRHSLNTSNTHDRMLRLVRENDLLQSEIAILRVTPHPDSSSQAHPAVLQVQQLTLALRRLSDKLSFTEDALLARTTELAHAASEAVKAKFAADSAYELAARTRGREEAGKMREMELEWEIKAAKEAVKLSDLVVNEYADLVRSLEERGGMRTNPHSRSTPPPANWDNGIVGDSVTPSSVDSPSALTHSLSEGKLGLQRLFSEFSATADGLQAELLRSRGELAVSEARAEAERKGTEHIRMELAKAQFDLQKLMLDDSAAARMVSRYMKFSQKSTDSLQDALVALKIRHAATIETLSAQLSALSARLQSSETNVERLRYMLDELGGDMMKETYGRRQEVALRIRMVNREEYIREELERWVLRAEEAAERGAEAGYDIQGRMVKDARTLLLSTLSGPPTNSTPTSGCLARLITAQNAVEALVKELASETARRLKLESLLAQHGMAFTTESNDAAASSRGELDSVELLAIPPGSNLAEHAIEQSSSDTPSVPTSRSANTFPSIIAVHEKVLPSLTPLTLVQQEEPLNTLPVALEYESLASHTHHNVEEQQMPLRPLIPSALLIHNEEDTETSVAQAAEIDITASAVVAQPLGPLPGDSADTDHSSASPNHPIMRQGVGLLPPLSPPSYQEKSPHPLLADLARVKERYSDLQRGFRDCHVALEALKNTMATTYNSSDSGQNLLRPNSGAPQNSFLSIDVLHAALERLNDYTEDARVELEIRTADEALVARGFETLLSVPGALSSSAPSISSSRTLNGNLTAHDPALSQSEAELQITNFLSDAEPGVEVARRSLSRKLDDIKHDIAVLKLAIHDAVLSLPAPLTAPGTSRGGGWTSWIRNSPSVSSSPASDSGLGPGPTPTFGTVMTSPRLRHSPSLNLLGNSMSQPASGAIKDPFSSLGLKVPMPNYVHIAQPQPRSRTLSTMYMLGLGAQRPSGSLTSLTRDNKSPTFDQLQKVNANTPSSEEESTTGEYEHDVE